jgi:hypothetical protein
LIVAGAFVVVFLRTEMIHHRMGGKPGFARSETGSERDATVIAGIEIEGGRIFVDRTREALKLVGATRAFQEVKPFISAIKEARCSGMDAAGCKPTFWVGEATWRSPIPWYASTIVHDGYHSKLYQAKRQRYWLISFTPENEWTGRNAEQECLGLQLDALKDINAPNYMIDYINKIMANPTYQDEQDRAW